MSDLILFIKHNIIQCAYMYTDVVLLSRRKPYTGKSDPNPEAFIALIPETNFLPSRSGSLVAY